LINNTILDSYFHSNFSVILFIFYYSENQKKFEKIAEDTKLNVVEFRKERDNYPQVLAKPSEVKKVKTVNDMDLNLVNMKF